MFEGLCKATELIVIVMTFGQLCYNIVLCSALTFPLHFLYI